MQHVYVRDNQFVHKGDLLLDIDPQDYSLLLTKSKQDLALAQQQATSAKQQITTAKATVVKNKSDFEFATQMATRYTNLYNQKAGSLQDMEKYQNQAVAAKQALEQSNASLDQATALSLAANTQISIAQSGVDNAQNNTAYTQLRSPVNGYISNLNLQAGELVSPGQKLFGLVDNQSWWVDINFKETQLKRIKPGQPAEIELDMYDHKYHGAIKFDIKNNLFWMNTR